MLEQKKCFPRVCVCGPHRQLVDGFLQPEADERGQGVVEDQQHDGIDKVVPLTLRVHDELPCVGAVALNDGRDAKFPAETETQENEQTAVNKGDKNINFEL